MSSPVGVGANGNGSGSWDPPAAAGNPIGELVSERPEIAVAAAFIGGIVAARIIKRLGR